MALAGRGATASLCWRFTSAGASSATWTLPSLWWPPSRATASGVRGSALVILEPGDAGEFERGAPVRKLGHRFASTTDPAFRLTVPASRIVGGYTIEQGRSFRASAIASCWNRLCSECALCSA